MSWYDYLLLIPDEEKRKEAYRFLVKQNIEMANEDYNSGIRSVKELSWFKRLFKKF